MHRHHRAFSLIELLVVVAIIAALAALVLPSLNVVRDAARKARCSSNLRQVGMAITVYTQDHRGLLPYANGVTANHRGHEGGPLDFLLAASLGYDMAPDQVETSTTGNPLFTCPAGPYRTTKAVWGGIKRVWVDANGYPGVYDDRNSYEGSLYYRYENSAPVAQGGAGGRDLRITKFQGLARIPWQFCSNRGAPGAGGFAGLQGSSLHRRFDRPTLFLDGHMQVLTSERGRTGGGNYVHPDIQCLMVPPVTPWNPSGDRQFPEN